VRESIGDRAEGSVRGIEIAPALYDAIGSADPATRRTEPRIAERIRAALGIIGWRRAA
jgi:hypothetical protein